MPTLWELVPDPDTLINLEPEELGGPLLRAFAEKQGSQNFFSGNSIAYQAFEVHPARYPPEYRHSVRLAILEATNWLEAAGLIMPAPDQAPSYKTLTRRGRRVTNAERFREYRKASLLPQNLLDPKLVAEVWTTFIRGDYDTAVFQAFKAVEVAVRDRAQLASAEIGVRLMRSAFHPETGRLRDAEQDPAERQALMELFSGSIGSYKNPHSHRNVEIDAVQAVEMIILASHLPRIVEARSSAVAI